MLASAYLCVRDIDGAGGPVLTGWTATPQDAGWYTLTRAEDSTLLAAWRANTSGARALWALFGPADILEQLAATEAACMPAREAWRRRTEPAVRAWLRRWRHWRIDGQVRIDADTTRAVVAGTVALIPEGAQLPDPTTDALPWLLRADGSVTTIAAEAQVRVTAIHRPALGHTLAGLGLHTRLEDEPDRSA